MCNNLMKIFLILSMALLSACQTGQSDDEASTTTGNSGGTNTGGGTNNPGGSTSVTISAAAALPALSAGGSTQVTATLTDQGQAYLTATDVTFSSACIGSGLATVTSPVTSNSGIAVTTYTAKGCVGDDTITVSADIDGTPVSGSVTVNVQPASLGSIEFVSASPTNIELKGMGGAESSTITFKVLDTSGNPIANQDVTFSLNTSVGGLQFSPGTDTDTSGNDGIVSTIVQAGTVATSVRVTATVSSTGLSSQSDQLVVTTGLPDNDSFSLSLSVKNPEAWDIDGAKVQVSAFLADRFNNPVPDGTQVVFTTEGGSIGGSCLTDGGACSVDWTSQNPRPANGRASILATAIGEESFTDSNGNAQFDAGETFVDLPEAFLDDNENGVYDLGVDSYFADFNSNGIHDPADTTYNGIVCSQTSCSGTSLNVRSKHVLVMAESNPAIGLSTSTITESGVVIVTVVGQDTGQIMPAGTTIEASVDIGSLGKPNKWTVLSSNEDCLQDITDCQYHFSWNGSNSNTTAENGTMSIKVTSPSGVVDYVDVILIDNANP